MGNEQNGGVATPPFSADPERPQSTPGGATPRTPRGVSDAENASVSDTLPEPGGFDAHTHMDILGLPVDGVLDAARAAGITRVVNVGCDLPSSLWSVSAAAEHEDVYAAVAIHPN